RRLFKLSAPIIRPASSIAKTRGRDLALKIPRRRHPRRPPINSLLEKRATEQDRSLAIFDAIRVPYRGLPRSQRRYAKGSLPMHLVLFFIVAVGLYVLGMIVLALAAILGRVRGNRELKKLEPELR